MSFPHAARDLLGAPHYGHLATVNPDGSPQSSVIWLRIDELPRSPAGGSTRGPVDHAQNSLHDSIVFATRSRSQKAENIRREPRVALSIHDAINPYRAVEIRGRAEVGPVADPHLLDELANAYLGVDRYPYPRSGEGAEIRIVADRLVDHGATDPPPPRIGPLDDDLFGAPHFGHVATVSPGGQPHSSPMWIMRDDDDVVFWTRSPVKLRNLSANPTISISAHDEADPLRYAEVRGRAQLTPVDHTDLLDELARRYWDVDAYPGKPAGMSGVEVRVRVEHRTGFDGRR